MRVPAPVAYEAGADDPRVVLELAPEARWVAYGRGLSRAHEALAQLASDQEAEAHEALA